MSHQYATVGDTVYFYFAANDTSGSGGDGAAPLFDVREAGAAASAIPLLSGTPTLLTHVNYPAGLHEIAVVATVGNGFAADDMFAVFCTVAIDSQNPSGFVGSCKLTPIPTAAAVVDEWETQSQADPTGFHVNLLEIGGTAQTANDNGLDINTLLSRIIGTLETGSHNPATAAQIAVLGDWINAGRLDTILDAIAGDVVNIDGAEMRGTDGANTVVPDAAGTAPTAIEVRQEIDTNSTKSGYALSATGLDLILFNSVFLLASAKANWTDDLTAYTNGMAGKRVKGLTAVFVVEGSVGTGSTTTTIETNLTGYPDNIFRDTDISIEIATDQWQTQLVSSYNGTTGQFVVDEAFVSAPLNGNAVSLRLNHTHTLTEIKEQVRAEMDSNSTQLAAAVTLFTTQLTESYAADGVAPTPAQALMLIQQALTDFAIVATAFTIKQLDGSTTAAVLTLDSASAPTSATRTT